MKISAEFEYVRSTKNTHRYDEIGPRETHMCGAIYIKKAALGSLLRPQDIKVTIESE